MILKKKLIEVALPLEAINKASAREKSIRHGHPSTLHLWWARRPLAAARAVIFAQMVDDPSGHPDLFPTEAAQEAERQRLFKIIEDLVQWENTTNEEVLERAREEIRKSWRRTCAENADHPRAKELFAPDKLPGFHDPFAGGGALPLEAQRLGLDAYASDLNPVAVLINKAMIEIPPKFAGMPPVNPEARANKELFSKQWKGAEGLAEDVRYYGKWMRDEVEKRIGHLYPKVEVTHEMARERPELASFVGRKLTVITWLWARTVKSPNPAFAHVDIPLVSTFMLSTKSGKEAFLQPVLRGDAYTFAIRAGVPQDIDAAKRGTTAGKWGGFRCLLSDVPVPYDYIRTEGVAGRMGHRLLAVVVEVPKGRLFLEPTDDMAAVAASARPSWRPELDINYHPRDIKTQIYGLMKYGDLFTPRQLAALGGFAESVSMTRERVAKDVQANHPTTGAYADALALYLACAVDRLVDRCSALCGWDSGYTKIRNTFGRQALPMSWDYAECNPFSDSTGNFLSCVEWIEKCLAIGVPATGTGQALQADARTQSLSSGRLVSTDPPYYDNIGYADLSDFFYVWLRRSVSNVWPELFQTLAVPKVEELVATPYRHGGKHAAEAFFLQGMAAAMGRIAGQSHPAFPATIYYAFKQAESRAEDEGVIATSSTGWDTFLDAAVRAGFTIDGTWPIRTELSNRMIGSSNALASSIVLACRPRGVDATSISRREFASALRLELPVAVGRMQRGNIAPVDLAQAAIGPGMSVYSRHAKVLDADGAALSVRDALAMINQVLDETLAEQEGDCDADSRWALAWFEQHGFADGEYGAAETLSKAKNTSVNGLVEAGILVSKRGLVRLLRASEMPKEWDPLADRRLTAWEIVHHLIRVLHAGGEPMAADLAGKLGGDVEVARELCYRLYTICERKKRAAEALSYNALVQSWPEIMRLAREMPVEATSAAAPAPQTTMFDDGAKPKKKRTKGKS